jgi:hypothetical protein
VNKWNKNIQLDEPKTGKTKIWWNFVLRRAAHVQISLKSPNPSKIPQNQAPKQIKN